MARIISRTRILTASLLLVGATLGSSASAIIVKRDPVCDQQVADLCASQWQAWGYNNYADCVPNEQCIRCPPNYGYLCGYDPRNPYSY
ncbi:MAG: hypothetical protein ACJ8ER_08315 [Allosphingosinicella sp.]